MGILNIMNSLNGGRGMRFLTEKGGDILYKKEREEKKKRKIHWKKDVSDEFWYREMKKDLFKPEYEGLYWEYGRAVKR